MLPFAELILTSMIPQRAINRETSWPGVGAQIARGATQAGYGGIVITVLGVFSALSIGYCAFKECDEKGEPPAAAEVAEGTCEPK